jgi:hypothetical protein
MASNQTRAFDTVHCLLETDLDARRLMTEWGRFRSQDFCQFSADPDEQAANPLRDLSHPIGSVREGIQLPAYN